MDISYFNTAEPHDEGAELQLRGPDGELTECYLTVIGMDSKAMNDIRKDAQKAVVDKEYEDVFEALSSAKYASRMVKGWRGMESEGKEIKFTKDMICQFLETAPYLRMQIATFAGNRKNFIKG